MPLFSSFQLCFLGSGVFVNYGLHRYRIFPKKTKKNYIKMRILSFSNYAFSGHAILEVRKKSWKNRAKPHLQKGLLKFEMKGAIFRAEQLSPFFLLVDTRLFFAPAKNELEFKEKAGQSTKTLVGSRRKNRKMIKKRKDSYFFQKTKKQHTIIKKKHMKNVKPITDRK